MSHDRTPSCFSWSWLTIPKGSISTPTNSKSKGSLVLGLISLLVARLWQSQNGGCFPLVSLQNNPKRVPRFVSFKDDCPKSQSRAEMSKLRSEASLELAAGSGANIGSDPPRPAGRFGRFGGFLESPATLTSGSGRLHENHHSRVSFWWCEMDGGRKTVGTILAE